MNRMVAGILFIALTVPAWAHKASDSYLRLDVTQEHLMGEWDIALRDLDFALGLDADGNAELTWGEVRGARERIEEYAYSRLQLSTGDGGCAMTPDALSIDSHSDGGYAVLRFHARCARPVAAINVDYHLLFDLDAQHRGLLKLTSRGQVSSAVFAPDRSRQRFDIGAETHVSSFGEFMALGAGHILDGVDHLLFLFALLLPSVVRRVGERWCAVERVRPALVGVTKIVTAFTIAHSITLALAVLGIAQPPVRLVESVIAASIVFAALNNVWPVVSERSWIVAFGFGLMHGFGFAGALTDLGLASGALGGALLAFNLGVELAQLALVALVVPAMFALRRRVPYRRVILAPGSALIALVGTIWFLERVFAVSIVPMLFPS